MIHPFAFRLLQPHKKQLILLAFVTIGYVLALIGQMYSVAYMVNELLEGGGLGALYEPAMYLIIAILLRPLFSHLQKRITTHLAAAVKAKALHDTEKGIFHFGQPQGEGALLHMLTDGMDHVEAYIKTYVPQLLYVLIIPIMLAVAMMSASLWVGIILLITYPLIPFFMMLIGKKAEAMNEAQWERMSILSGHFLDVLSGITTLQVFGRAKEQLDVIARMSADFRDSTLRVLRVAFLSAFVLELVGTISTAIIAVYFGIALLYGEIEFQPAFFILLLAPEFYAPLRELGSAFHTGMAGKVSLDKLAIMNAEQPLDGKRATGKILVSPIESITVEDVSYAYDNGQGIRQVNCRMQKGEPLMIIGESGAGKSTLTYALMHLVEPQAGTIKVNGEALSEIDASWWHEQISYVPQAPHLYKGTIRHNLTFGKAIDEGELIRICQSVKAHDFIMALPDGYDTEIGEDGLGLSGGEKQRLALARALIKDAPIFIFDEVTAHLDVVTEALIMDTMANLWPHKIVITIGHRLELMSYMKAMLVLEKGEQVAYGTYEEIQQQSQYVRNLLGASPYRREIDTLSLANTVLAAEEASQGRAVSHDIDVTMASWQGVYTRLLGLVKQHKFLIFLTVLFALGTIIMNIGLLMTSTWLITTAASHVEITVLSLAIVGVRFFGVSRAVCRYIERYVSHTMAFNSLYRLRLWLYEHLEPLAPAIFNRFMRGDLVGRMMGDIEILQFFFLRLIAPPVVAVVITMGMALYIASYDYVWALVFLALAIVAGIVLPMLTYYRLKQPLWHIFHERSQVKAYIVDALKGRLDAILYHQVKPMREELQRREHAVARSQGEVDHIQSVTGEIFLGLSSLALPLGLLIGAGAQMSPVSIAMLTIGWLAYFECLQPMLQVGIHHRESMAAMSRFLDVTDPAKTNVFSHVTTEDVDRTNHTSSIHDTNNTNRIHNANHTNSQGLVLENIHFQYDQKSLYDGLSLSIELGEKVAIIGASGAGKSTLLSLLEGFYAYDGKISYQGKVMHADELETWRNHFTMIAQDTYIFHATLEDNVRLAKPKATKEEIIHVFQEVGLWEWVETLEKGLKTMVGSGAMKMSGGQKQRLAIARALLRPSDILLLDEPLEGLDALTRKQIQKVLDKAMEGHIAIYITHYLAGLETMDRIICLDGGKIVEEGDFETLMAKGGYFYQYYHLGML